MAEKSRMWLPVLVVLAIAGAAHAEPAEQDGPPAPRPAPDFLFGRPHGTLGIRASWISAGAGSDWYDFVTDQLSLDKKNFNGPAIGTELGIALAPRVDLMIGFDYNQTTTASEYRNFVDNNRLPIEQTTVLRGANISGGVKFALTERGREIGRLAWVPRKVVPYVGAGGGALWFQVQQFGDFVDYQDLSVFGDLFQASGWTPSAHVFGGVDVRVLRRAYVTFEARHMWAAGTLGRDWIDFEPIDLSGLRLSAGFNFILSEVR
jgi:hypothetical protein